MITLDFQQILSARLTIEQLIDLNGGIGAYHCFDINNNDSIEVLHPRFLGDLTAIQYYNSSEDIFYCYLWMDGKWCKA